MLFDELPAFMELVGVVLASRGVLRESFAQLDQPRPFGEGRFGEGTYGGAPNGFHLFLVRIGRTVRLLAPDGQLTATDRRENAAYAVAGIVFVIAAILIELFREMLVGP